MSKKRGVDIHGESGERTYNGDLPPNGVQGHLDIPLISLTATLYYACCIKLLLTLVICFYLHVLACVLSIQSINEHE